MRQPRFIFETVRREVKDYATYITVPAFLQSFLLGFCLSLFDSTTDFSFAASVPFDCPDFFNPNETNSTKAEAEFVYRTIQDENPCGGVSPITIQVRTYFFIALPGLLIMLSGFHKMTSSMARKCCSSCQGPGCHCCGHITTLLLLTMLLLLAYAVICLIPRLTPAGSTDRPSDTFPTLSAVAAILSAVGLLGVKLLAVFVHGPETKKLAVWVTSLEAQHESALQLSSVLSLVIQSGQYRLIGLLSMASSVLVLGKAGSEAFLTFGRENRLEAEASLKGKLCLLASLIPVFLLSSFFRVGTLAVSLAWMWYVSSTLALVAAATLPPLLVMLVLQGCGKLEDLEADQMLRGSVAELVSISLWGSRSWEAGRKINLWMSLYLTLLYTTVLAWVIASPTAHLPELMATLHPGWVAAYALRLRLAAASCLALGWTSLPLVVYKLYLLR